MSYHQFILISMIYLTLLQEDVVVDGKLVTSRGPGTSFKFALQLVAMLVNQAKADEIAAAMLV